MSKTVIIRDMDKLEAILEAPGDLESVATIRVMRKKGHVFVEMEADGSLSRHTLKRMMRIMAVELGR